MSTPMFKPGQSVQFKPSVVIEMQRRLSECSHNPIGPFPFGRLTIYSAHYCKSTNQYKYNYEYGTFNNHEGYANESDLQHY